MITDIGGQNYVLLMGSLLVLALGAFSMARWYVSEGKWKFALCV